MRKEVLRAQALDGYLSDTDVVNIGRLDHIYDRALELFPSLEKSGEIGSFINNGDSHPLVTLFNQMGHFMQQVVENECNIVVYPFAAAADHGQASRMIAKIRNVATQRHEFIYYTQRVYEQLFTLAYNARSEQSRNYFFVKTPVDKPRQNYAIHKIPNIDRRVDNSVMCVMLRGALLPSMIISKEIEEYSSSGYITPFALFRISRDDSKQESDMEYILDLDRSFFDLDMLHDKDLIFADPMNATGGSLVTIVKYLTGKGVKPRSISFFNVISALKGALRIVRALENTTIYTMWMDAKLNNKAYILPGLGDAGDRLNGRDRAGLGRNIIQLIADYGNNISELYRSQVRKIEEIVLEKTK